VIEESAFQGVREERGRFRTFLLVSVRHFLANERDAARAQKLGGGTTDVRHLLKAVGSSAGWRGRMSAWNSGWIAAFSE